MTAFLTVRAPVLSRTVHILCCIVNWLLLSTFIQENYDDDDDDDDDTSTCLKRSVFTRIIIIQCICCVTFISNWSLL